jgi:peptidoglycan-associated lipoprotein
VFQVGVLFLMKTIKKMEGRFNVNQWKTKNTVLFYFGLLSVMACSSNQSEDLKPDLVSSVSSVSHNPEDQPIANADNSVSSDVQNAMGLKTVFFAYDSFRIDGTENAVIKENAKILKENQNVAIQIEGHCDQRGGIQYNLALGEKRANAIKSILVSLGIEHSRIEIISYGKERPLDSDLTEAAYAKNRRGNFVIVSK